jgi:23S rRNA (pseudouridine1915-N3)-methyltransferase
LVKLRIVAVGKDKDRWISDGVAHYAKLLKRYAAVEIVTVSSPKSTASLPSSQLKKKEGEQLTKSLSGRGAAVGVSVALTDTGKRMDTLAFSKWLDKTVTRSGGAINFIIGGAHGLDECILSGADDIISLSPLTFSHQLVRLVLLEQLYRAFSILHNTDYHK